MKGPYGPYAENLRHVLRDIEGHLISGYADGGDARNKQLALVAGAVGGAEAFLESHATTHERFNRVVGQVEGFETPFGWELLAAVHWVVTQEQAVSKADVERATYGWAPRKRQISPGQIAWAMERLRSEGWLSVWVTGPGGTTTDGYPR